MKRWPLWLALALLLALATQLPALWRYAVATTMSLHAQDQARQWQSGGRWANPNAQPAQPSLEQWSLASQSIEEAIDVNPDDAQLHEALALLHINHLRWHSPNPAEAHQVPPCNRRSVRLDAKFQIGRWPRAAAPACSPERDSDRVGRT
jgi:hypothetical protein